MSEAAENPIENRSSETFIDGPSHSTESIGQAIASLQTLGETLPDITQMADGAPYTTQAIKRSVDMLGAFRARVFNEEQARSSKRKEAEFDDLMLTLERVRAVGIEEGERRATCRANTEKIAADAKEARKGRKRGAKKS